MEKFLFFNVIVSALNVFIIVYAYSLNFFPKKWRKKVNQRHFGRSCINFFYNAHNVFLDNVFLFQNILNF